MIRLGCGILVLFFLVGCSHKATNEMILANNGLAIQNIAQALSEAETPEAVVAMSILFATGAGQQKIVRGETALDYINGIVPLANVLAPYIKSNSRKSQDAVAAGRDVYISSSKADITTTTSDSHKTGTE